MTDFENVIISRADIVQRVKSSYSLSTDLLNW